MVGANRVVGGNRWIGIALLLAAWTTTAAAVPREFMLSRDKSRYFETLGNLADVKPPKDYAPPVIDRAPSPIDNATIHPSLPRVGRATRPGAPSPGKPRKAEGPCVYPGVPRGTTSTDYLQNHRGSLLPAGLQLIIKENISSPDFPAKPDEAKWSDDAGSALRVVEGPVLGAYLVELPMQMNGYALLGMIQKMFDRDKKRKASEKGCRYDYIEISVPAEPAAFPDDADDPFFDKQWNLQNSQKGSANFVGAWKAIDIWTKTRTLVPVTIAVVDGGFDKETPGNRLELAYAHRFDFGARQLDPHEDHSTFPRCEKESDAKGCHGEMVGAVIAARTNNKIGLAGALAIGPLTTFKVAALGGAGKDAAQKIIPIPFYWMNASLHAVALPIYRKRDGTFYERGSSGTCWGGLVGRINDCLGETRIDNPAGPAKVINWSFSTSGVACSFFQQDGVNRLRSAGAIIVASAGNSGKAFSAGSPANCEGVIVATAHDRYGIFGGVSENFSSMGIVGRTISAPGIDVPVIGMPKEKRYDSFPEVVSGTSFAAPHISATIALMLAVNPSLTYEEVLTILIETGREHTSEWGKNPYRLLDAGKAVERVIANMPPVPAPTTMAPRTNARRVLTSSSGDYEAGPIWSNTDATDKCPRTCSKAGLGWNLNWRTTVPGRMSVCGCVEGSSPVSNRPMDAPANQQTVVSSDRQAPTPVSPQVPAPVFQWSSLPASQLLQGSGAMSGTPPATQQRGPGDYQAGPIWNNADAQGKCPAVCSRARLTWNRNWLTTVPGQMSVCGCQ